MAKAKAKKKVAKKASKKKGPGRPKKGAPLEAKTKKSRKVATRIIGGKKLSKKKK